VREERRQLVGDQTIAEPLDLRGSVAGNVTVVAGGKVYVRGAIHGDLIIQDGGRVHLYGAVQGNVRVEAGAKLIHGGVVGGNLINAGGRLHIQRSARTEGKIKESDGETTREP
jgi:cytoskeletal protein CcmA (bactofilin family)